MAHGPWRIVRERVSVSEGWRVFVCVAVGCLWRLVARLHVGTPPARYYLRNNQKSEVGLGYDDDHGRRLWR